MLDIDTAIKHCLEVAEENEAKAQKIGVQFLGTTKDREATECRECAADHRQLAEWLMGYKDLREENNFLISEFDRLINGELLKKSEQIAEYKRLLKAAVEDMYNSVNDVHCKYCSKWHTDQCQGTSHLDCYIENKFKWRYADEALKLLGGSENE